MIAIVFALLAAASNALSSVLQRRAARVVAPGESFRLGLVLKLVRNGMWLGGIGALITGFLFQAAALSTGGLSLVQPILVTELPFTMILIALFFRTRLNRRSWLAIGALTVGLATLLAAAGPAQGRRYPGEIEWAIAGVVTVGLIGYLLSCSRLSQSGLRAAILGVASGLGFSFTAALMKEAVRVLPHGLVAVLTSWSVYAMVAAGVGSLLLLQDALHSGSLVAVQPGLNIADPVASIAYGVGLFGEEIRLGAWSLLEVLGVGLMLFGSARLAQSPLVRKHAEVTAGAGDL